MELTISHQQTDELQNFAANFAEGLCEADGDFEIRNGILDYLGINVIFSFEAGVEVAQLSYEFG